jgi:hypothetical protein
MRARELRVGLPVRHKKSSKQLGEIERLLNGGLCTGRYPTGEPWLAHCAEIEKDLLR